MGKGAPPAKTTTKKTTKTTKKNTQKGSQYLIRDPQKMASRDVKLALNPQLQALQREQGRVKDDYGEYMNQLGFLYNLVGENLGQIGKTTGEQSKGVMDAYSQGTGGLLESLGLGQSTAPDAAAYANALGAQGLAGQRALGTMASDAVQTNASMQNQGELERLVSGRNAMGKQSDMLDELRNRRQDILANRPMMLEQRLDELRQLAWEQWMAEREFRLRANEMNGNDAGMRALFGGMYGGLPKPKGPKGKGNKPGTKKAGKKSGKAGGTSTKGGVQR